jgi:hypothetical protein
MNDSLFGVFGFAAEDCHLIIIEEPKDTYMKSRFGILLLGVVAMVAILAPQKTTLTMPTASQPDIILPGTFDVLDIVLNARYLYLKTLTIRDVNVECVDEKRCLIHMRFPFDDVVSVDFSHLSLEDRRSMFLGRFRVGSSHQLTGQLLGDILVAKRFYEDPVRIANKGIMDK